MKKIKSLFLVIMLAVTSLFLGGCSSDKHDIITINTYGNYKTFQNFEHLLADKHPEINVEFVSYPSANPYDFIKKSLENDNATDIIISPIMLDDNLVTEKLIDLSLYSVGNDVYHESATNDILINEKLYMLPINQKLSGIYCNKTLLKSKGYLNTPDNLNDLLRIYEETNSSIGFIDNSDILKQILNTSYIENGACDITAEALELFDKLTSNGFVAADSASEEFLKGNTLFYIGTFNKGKTFIDNNNEYELIPYITNSNSSFIQEFECYAGINKNLTTNNEKLDDCRNILRLMASSDGQKALKPFDYDNAIVSSLSSNGIEASKSLLPDYSNWMGITDDISLVLKDYLLNNKSQEQVLDKVAAYKQKFDNKITISEAFTQEQTRALLAQIIAEKLGVDAVILTPTFINTYFENIYTVGTTLYKGEISYNELSSICPIYYDKYAYLSLTGSQITEVTLLETDIFANYELYTKNGVELDALQSYNAIMLVGSYNEKTTSKGKLEIKYANINDIVLEYLSGKDTISTKDIIYS